MDFPGLKTVQNSPNSPYECQPNKKIKFGCLSKVIIVFIIIIVIGIFGNFHSEQEKYVDIYAGKKLDQTFIAGSTEAQSKIVLIRVDGIILSGEQKWAESADADLIANQIYEAKADPDVAAIILQINSPGGEVSAIDKIYNYIQDFRGTGRPVVSLFDSVAASGGYYIAAQTDWIVTGRLSITGSIGVIIDALKYYDLLGKIGVQDEVYKTGQFKDILNGARPTTEEEKKLLINMINESYEVFIDIVSKGRISRDRKLTPQYVKTTMIGDGRIFSGQEALNLKLVDQIGYYPEALDKTLELTKLNKDNVKIIAYEQSLSFAQMLNRLLKSRFNINLSVPGTGQHMGVIDNGTFYYLYRGF